METMLCNRCGQAVAPGAVECAGCGQFLPGGYRPAPSAQGAHAPRPAPLVRPFDGPADALVPTFRLYKEHFGLVAGHVLPAAVPMALISYVSTLKPESLSVQLLAMACALAFSLLMTGALTYAVNSFARGGVSPTLEESYGVAFRKLPQLFACVFVVGLITVVGLLMLVVPGLIWSTMYALVIPFVVLEDRNISDALDGSANLTKGYRLKVFITYWAAWVAVAGAAYLAAGNFFGHVWAVQPGLLSILLELTAELLNASLVVLVVFIYLGLYARRSQTAGADGTVSYAP